MNKKQIISIIIVILIAILAFNYLFGNREEDSSLLIPDSSVGDTTDARYILSLLNRMSSVRLDDSIFFSQAFGNLKDTSVILAKPSVGRINPFAPINPSEAIFTAPTSSQQR